MLERNCGDQGGAVVGGGGLDVQAAGSTSGSGGGGVLVGETWAAYCMAASVRRVGPSSVRDPSLHLREERVGRSSHARICLYAAFFDTVSFLEIGRAHV